MAKPTYRVRKIVNIRNTKHQRIQNQSPVDKDISIKSKLAFHVMDHEMPDTPDARIRGLKSLKPISLQCQKCFLLVATLPAHGIMYLINMSYFMQNKVAIDSGDHRRLCPTCQLVEWKDYLNSFEADDARAFSREQSLVARRILI